MLRLHHFRKTITIFKNAITQIQLLNDQNLAPSSGKVHKDLDLVEVSNIMTQMETSSESRTDSMLENYIKRFTKLIFTSTNSSIWIANDSNTKTYFDGCIYIFKLNNYNYVILIAFIQTYTEIIYQIYHRQHYCQLLNDY